MSARISIIDSRSRWGPEESISETWLNGFVKPDGTWIALFQPEETAQDEFVAEWNEQNRKGDIQNVS